MEIGVLGHHGVHVVLHAVEECKQEKEAATILHLTMEEQHAKAHNPRIKLATAMLAHKVRKVLVFPPRTPVFH